MTDPNERGPRPSSIFSAGFDAKQAQAALEERVRQRRGGREPSSPHFADYLKVAALCRTFPPAQALIPGEDHPTAREVLLYVAEPTGTGSRPWALTAAARARGLASIADLQDLLLMVDHADALLDPERSRAMREYATGARSTLEKQSYDELRASHYAISRLVGTRVPLTLPPLERVTSALGARQTFEALFRLTDAGVVGRDHELDRLRRYVGILEAKSVMTIDFAEVRRSFREYFAKNRQPPMLIHGPGGIGKSTLLAEFVQEHAEYADDVRFPLCFLDFERASLSPRDPLGLIEEMCRQLAFGFADAPEATETLRARIEAIRESPPPFTDDDAATPASDEFGRYEQAKGLMPELANAVHQLADPHSTNPSEPEVPFLVILDSFEGAQQRSVNAVEQLWELFLELQSSYPLLRVVVSGRAPVDIPWRSRAHIETLELGELKHDARAEMLVGRGLPRDVAQRLSAALSGNPLTLRLAVSLFERLRERDPEAKWLRTLDRGGLRRFFFDNELLIQGQLYRRILYHMKSEKLRALAHPGLVLRRITPRIIAKVLAGPCGLGPIDDVEARNLFDALAGELDLVERRPAEGPGGEDALYHRPDVRSTMLEQMASDKPSEVAEIEAAAIDFYAPSTSPVERAEEIYHRLRRGDHPRDVQKRWLPDVERYLDDALDEIPPKAQAFLTSRLSGVHSLDDSVFAEADLADWEQLVATRARYLIEKGAWSDVLEMLAERTERSPGSLLYPVEARARQALGELEAARRVVDTGLESLGPENAPQVRLELLVLGSQIDRDTGQRDQAISKLSLASHLAANLHSPKQAVELLLDARDLDPSAHADEATAGIIDIVRNAEPARLAGEFDFAQRVAQTVGAEDSIALKNIFKASKSAAIVDSAPGFGNALGTLMTNDPQLADQVQALAYDAGYRRDQTTPEAIPELVQTMVADRKFVPFVDQLFDVHGGDRSFRKAVVDSFFPATGALGKMRVL